MLRIAGVGAGLTDMYYQEMTWLLGEGTAQELLLLWDAFMDVPLCKILLLHHFIFQMYFTFDTVDASKQYQCRVWC